MNISGWNMKDEEINNIKHFANRKQRGKKK
jgi:hypothetical protein